MKNAFEYEAELAALRKELATSINTHRKHAAKLIGERMVLKERLADAERRNALIISEIVALPDEFNSLTGCENTAGARACIDYISEWVAALKSTESGASE